MWRWTAPVVLLVILSGVAGAATFPAADGSPTGLIAFASDRAGAFDVYLANADGSGIRRVTFSGGDSPVWSPDGSRIAYLRAGAIDVAAADGTAAHQAAVGEDAAWSPDGTRLAFEHNWDISIVNADGTGLRRLTRAARQDDVNTLAALPSWSPDGSKIAFERFDGLYEVEVASGEVTRVSDWGVDPSSDARPRWSPDGTEIAFIGNCRHCASGSTDEYMISPIGTDTLRIVDVRGGRQRVAAKEADDTFTWSPDGSRIAFSQPSNAKDNAPSEIYTLPAGGGLPTRVTHSLAGESSESPRWSPDGAWLVFMRNRFPASWYADSWDVDVIRPDGSGRAELTGPFPAGGTNDAPVWSSGSTAPEPGTPVERTPSRTAPLSSGASYDEIDADGRLAALTSSASALPMFWRPGAAVPTRSRAAQLECDGAYDLALAGDHAAWLCDFRHGVTEPVDDVYVYVTSAATRRSAEVTSIELQGHYPPESRMPRVDGSGPLLVYNPDGSGSRLYRIDTGGAKPRLRLIAKRVLVADVNLNRIVGWRGAHALVTVGTSGQVLGTAPFARSATTSVRLDGGRLFTTSETTLTQSDLNGRPQHTWTLVDEGGGPPTLEGVSGDLAVYVSGVAIHVLRLSTGQDVPLSLPNQGPWLDVDLTSAGLYYAYDAPRSTKPGRMGIVPYAELAGDVSS